MHRHYLPTPLRRTLEKTIKQARIVAEEGAGDAIRRLGVAEAKPPVYLGETERNLRRRLRAHARALGDRFDRDTEILATRKLVEATAYAHWHRMLFARFLAERGLLHHPEHGVAVTLEDCRELAAEEGLPDAWAAAERYAALMLPGVFRIDDPVLELDLDPAHNQALIRLVTDLDATVFQAEDSLGWTYQFWRAAEKAAINESGVKIGADELPAVTQLFTEPYMVRFLLHNTLGAWWACKVLADDPTLARTAVDEDALRAACSLPDYTFDMLRFVRDGEDSPWRPAAGTFSGWPEEVKAVTMLDPCCGSGHFLTEALGILAALRQVEEHLTRADAVVSVLRDNLHGLEIDGRCVQIATFAVALSAWRIGAWQVLPVPHIAWVGAQPPLPKQEFVALGDSDSGLASGLAAMHTLFALAPTLGSLIDPLGGDLGDNWRLGNIEHLVGKLVDKARRAEPDTREGALAARGMADAMAILTKRFTLQATNVPFLGKSKQADSLSIYVKRFFEKSKANLATTMLDRMTLLGSIGGTIAFVSPQEWFFLGVFKKFRKKLLHNFSVRLISDLGPAAFRDMNWWAARTAVGIISLERASHQDRYHAIDGDTGRDLEGKPWELTHRQISTVIQTVQACDPDAILSATPYSQAPKLADVADVRQGIGTADMERYISYFWEPDLNREAWERYQTAPERDREWSGRDRALLWENGRGALSSSPQARVCGQPAWGHVGIAVAVNRELPRTIYTGEKFDCTVAIIVAKNSSHTAALISCAFDANFTNSVRNRDQALSVTESSFGKIEFNLEKWSKKAVRHFVDGLPSPYSDDPSLWIFHGHPANALRGTALHVAIARLSGYRWPAETDSDMRLSDKARAWIAKSADLPAPDNDGLLGGPAVAGEKPLADRLRAYLTAAFGADWSDALELSLVADADEVLDKKQARDCSLEAWVRDRAFRQHCALFRQRPFLWHISDGLKDGFSVFVHYHRFDQANLRKLTYTLLGDWLARARDEGNELRLEKGRVLQQKLERVLEGEAPFDIFVRWKPLHQQPFGWGPDLDDGVRQNIRPFIKAGVLAHDLSKIQKDKDRGQDVPSAPWYDVFKGERRNDRHTTLAEKRAAREAVGEK